MLRSGRLVAHATDREAMGKGYNTTDLSPFESFEREVRHRDLYAHVFRWSHIAKEARARLKNRPVVVDFGCGKGALFEVFYRNRTWPAKYYGLDIRKLTIEAASKRFIGITPGKGDPEFIVQDLVEPTIDLTQFQADIVCSFEVMEHVGRQRSTVFLENFQACGKPDATYFLSTPKYDEKVGAAGNHTYDSGDGRGEAVQEHTYDEVWSAVNAAGFRVKRVFGTFASIKDYKEYLEEDPVATEMFKRVREYYDSELTAVIMAPLVPAELARNCLWILERA